jgi:hypothetical protein
MLTEALTEGSVSIFWWTWLKMELLGEAFYTQTFEFLLL